MRPFLFWRVRAPLLFRHLVHILANFFSLICMKRFLFLMSSLLIMAFSSCSKKEETHKVRDYDSIVASDTLRAATLYGSSTYFILHDKPFRFDY